MRFASKGDGNLQELYCTIEGDLCCYDHGGKKMKGVMGKKIFAEYLLLGKIGVCLEPSCLDLA